jgi:hypothetical protein
MCVYIFSCLTEIALQHTTMGEPIVYQPRPTLTKTRLPSGIKLLESNPQNSLGLPCLNRITSRHTPAGETTVQPRPNLSNTGLPSGILLQANPQYSLGLPCPIQDYLPAYSCRRTHGTAWAYTVHYRITFWHTPAGEPKVQPGPTLSNTGLPSGMPLQANPQFSLGLPCPIQDYLPAYPCRWTHSTAMGLPCPIQDYLPWPNG